MQPKTRLRILLVCALIILSSVACLAKTVYVKTTGLDTNDGLSWDTAKKTVAAGITASASGDEIWVAAGTYVECLRVNAGVALYGGFVGSETVLSQRNWTTNRTILDGNQADTVVHTPSGATSTTRIDGFTVRNGSQPGYVGGGIYCSSSSPTISNNTITGSSVTWGGGIYCTNSSPTITNNTITGNSATYGGGGICCFSSSPTISNNTITGNSAPSYGGGGIYCSSSSPTISNNTITGNSASNNGGGGIYCNDSSPTITNNTITGNSASYFYGGGIYCYTSSPQISNNIVAFNSSGIYKYTSGTGTPVLRNNCVYGNTAYNYYGLSAGAGDISLDPRLVNLTGGDYHLMAASPCIDTGDDDAVQPGGWLDMDGQWRIQGAYVDMGADEYEGIARVATPGFSPGGGTYSSPRSIVITSATPDAVIHYTTNGLDPTESDPIVSGAILVDTNLTIKARAWKTGWTTSPVKSATYTFQPVTPSFDPDAGMVSSALNVAIVCATPGAVIHYTTNGVDPAESDPTVAGPVFVDGNLTLKASAWKIGWTTSTVKSAAYTIVPLSGIKKLASGSTVSIPGATVAAVASTTMFYVEADDRSCGIMVFKSGHGLTVGKRVDIEGTLSTGSNGEKWVSAISLTDRGTGSIKPVMLSNRDVGGGDWYYDASTGAGQKGVKDNAEFYAQGVNNIGMLIATTGMVTYSTTGYFYMDDGYGLADNSGHVGIKVMGSVPQPVPLPPGWTPVGKQVIVTGISTCFKATAPSTDLYRLIRATTVGVVN